MTRYLDADGHALRQGETAWLPALFCGPCVASMTLHDVPISTSEIAFEA